MTVRQIADIAGCSDNTVRKMANQLYPEVRAEKRGKAKTYEEYQCRDIMSKLPKRNNVEVNSEVNNAVDYVEIGKMIAMAVTSAMTPILQELRQAQPKESKQLLLPPTPDVKPRALLRQLVNDYASSINISHREAWNELYKQFYYRCNESIKTKAKNLNIIPLDYLENENKLLTACSIMKDLIK